MTVENKTSNSGVHASRGFEFQKHCALYILFEKYEELKKLNFFICLEHHDDLIFCYQTDDEKIISIDAYQVKKASGEWSQSAIYEILKKMTEVGIGLKNDKMYKLDTYTHNLEFLTNNTINLNNKKRNELRRSHTINETTNRLKLTELNPEIITIIKSEIQKLSAGDSEGLTELNNISMAYIDLPKSYKNQKYSLVGHFNKIFGNKVNDHNAAVETLLLLFKEVENTLNSGNVIRLMDQSKRISSNTINETINIITTQKMAFDFWREEKKEASKKLKIPISERKNFEDDFINSIDRFKDKKQVEHQKIFSFVNNNKNALTNFIDETDCIEYLYEEFLKNINSTLPQLSIKAAIFAAYIEVRAEIWE